MAVPVKPSSILLLTLDSCRYDTFLAADAPNLKSIGPLHRAMAPGNFTFSSHAAMFMGFTPGLASEREPFVNPKFGKIFKLASPGMESNGREFMTLDGRNVVDGLRQHGYATIGTGAVGWFDPSLATGQHLTGDFEEFFFPERIDAVESQLDFVDHALERHRGKPIFLFMNLGETHVPYVFDGAPWGAEHNPCVPFSSTNDAAECRRRQRACVEHLDERLASLLERFGSASIIVCADHGDAWGEDGLWEHGIHHDKVLEVPLLFRLRPAVIDAT